MHQDDIQIFSIFFRTSLQYQKNIRIAIQKYILPYFLSVVYYEHPNGAQTSGGTTMSDNLFLSVIENEGIESLAGREFVCPCGKTHTIGTQKFTIAPGAIHHVLSVFPDKTPFIVADKNTWPLAPASWQTLPHYLFSHEHIEADEYSLGDLLIESQLQPFDYMIALGSGNIGDCTRYLANALHKPFINVTTAPSMDGAASRHSPLIHHKFKTTYTAKEPYAIFFDLDILSKAPREMIAAGLADIEGKHVATLDWVLGHLSTGEDYCPEIRELTMEAVRRCEAAVDGLHASASVNDEAIRPLAEALMLSSLAMQLNITSRPASGMEHLISHSWENYGIMQGIPAGLHGDKVGIGTLIACDVYESFFLKETPTGQSLGYDRLLQAVNDPSSICRTKPKHQPSINYQDLLDHWDDLKTRAQTLVEMKPLLAANIQKAGGPLTPRKLGFPPEQVRYGFDHMTDGRPRVTIAHLIEDLGLEKEIFDPLCEIWSQA